MGVADSDLHIFVRATDEPDQQFLAWAQACSLDTSTNRPLFGLINYNIYYLQQSNRTNDKAFSLDVSTTIHEITHVLGFSQDMINLWIDPHTGQMY